MRESFKFYQSYLRILKQLSQQDGYAFMVGIAEFALNGKTPKFKKSLLPIFEAIKPNILADLRRHDASLANSYKGGAPKGNKNASKSNSNTIRKIKTAENIPESTQTQIATKTTKKQPRNNLETTKNNPNIKMQRANNEVICDLHANKNKNNNKLLYILSQKQRAKFFSDDEREPLLPENYYYHENDDYGECVREVADTILEATELSQQDEINYNGQTYTAKDFETIANTIAKDCVHQLAKRLAVAPYTNLEIKNRPLYILGVIFSEYEKFKNKEAKSNES